MLHMWRNRTEVDNLLRGPSKETIDLCLDEGDDGKVLTEKQRFELKEGVRRSALSFLVLQKQRINSRELADYAVQGFRTEILDCKGGARERINEILDADKCHLSEKYPSSDAVLISDSLYWASLNLFFIPDFTNKEDVVSFLFFFNYVLYFNLQFLSLVCSLEGKT